MDKNKILGHEEYERNRDKFEALLGGINLDWCVVAAYSYNYSHATVIISTPDDDVSNARNFMDSNLKEHGFHNVIVNAYNMYDQNLPTAIRACKLSYLLC